MLARLDYLSVRELEPDKRLELRWHVGGEPVEWITPSRSQDEIRLTSNQQLVLPESTSPLWLRVDAKSPSLAALDWEDYIYRMVGTPVSRIRRWTLPSWQRSPIGRVLAIVADSRLDKEIGAVLNELVSTTRDLHYDCVVATATPRTAAAAMEFRAEAPFEHITLELTADNDLRKSLVELSPPFDTIFVIADPWRTKDEVGLRLGDERNARFVASDEMVLAAARMGAAKIVLITVTGRSSEVARLFAHEVAEEAPLDIHVVASEEGNAADSVRAYLSSLVGETAENFNPAAILRYETPFKPEQLFSPDPSSEEWLEFAFSYVLEYTLARKLANQDPKLETSSSWVLPAQRIFEKYAARPFEMLVEGESVPKSIERAKSSWNGVLQALKEMRSIFGEDDERRKEPTARVLPGVQR
jgi:hypothetical protein